MLYVKVMRCCRNEGQHTSDCIWLLHEVLQQVLKGGLMCLSPCRSFKTKPYKCVNGLRGQRVSFKVNIKGDVRS